MWMGPDCRDWYFYQCPFPYQQIHQLALSIDREADSIFVCVCICDCQAVFDRIYIWHFRCKRLLSYSICLCVYKTFHVSSWVLNIMFLRYWAHSVLLTLGIRFSTCSFRQNDSEHDARRISSGTKRNLVMLEPRPYGLILRFLKPQCSCSFKSGPWHFVNLFSSLLIICCPFGSFSVHELDMYF